MTYLDDRPGLIRAVRLFYGLTLLLAVCAIFYPSLSRHREHSQDPFRFSDDVLQQVVPFLHLHDSELLDDDYSTEYFLAAVPTGYRLLYGALSRHRDPLDFTRTIHFALLALVLTGVFLAAFRLSGYTGAFLAVAICLSADIYFVKMAGGLPRAYAFPLFSLGTAALVWGRMRIFALLTLLAAAFYPLVAVIFSIALGLSLLFLPSRDRGTAGTSSLKKRLVFLTAIGLAVGLLALPPVIQLRPYGPSIGPADIAAFPEAGPGGRLLPTDHPPYADFLESARLYAEKSFTGSGAPFNGTLRSFADRRGAGSPLSPRYFIYKIYLILGVAGLAVLVARTSAGRRLLVLFLSFWAAHTISSLAAPYLFIPERYVAYALPPLMAIALPASLSSLGGFLFGGDKRPWAGALFALLLGGFFLGFFGSKGSTHAGLTVYVAEEDRPFYEFIGTLPKDALIAGMPDGPVNYLPYLSRRKVFVSFENHQVFHRAYAEEMRRRMRGLLRAYYATTMKPLLALRERYGVTHLIVSTRDYERAPTYFVPFNEMMRKGFRRTRANGSQVLKVVDSAGVYSFKSYTLLDLSLLDAY